jgi:hypothetical protein
MKLPSTTEAHMHPLDDKPDNDLLGLTNDDRAASAAQAAQAEEQAIAIVGPDADYAEAIKPTAKLIRMLSEDRPAAVEGLEFEEGTGTDLRRQRIAQALAAYHRAAMALRGHLRFLSIPAITSVFEAYGFDDAYYIVEGINALQRGTLRDEPISASAALLQGLIVTVGKWWVAMTGESIEHSFAPDAEHCSPYGGFGSEYIFRVLLAAGWRCSREEIADNLDSAIELMAEFEEGEGYD